MRYKLVGDNDGHDYIIPVDLEFEFDIWVKIMESDEELDADVRSFDEYRVNRGGWTFADPQGWK
jgi:hypothetical protein